MKEERLEKKDFTVKGTMMEKKNEKSFTKTIRAENEKAARETTFSLFGSKHKIKRRNISIKEIREGREDGKEK